MWSAKIDIQALSGGYLHDSYQVKNLFQSKKFTVDEVSLSEESVTPRSDLKGSTVFCVTPLSYNWMRELKYNKG